MRRLAVTDSLTHSPPLAPGGAGREVLQQDPRQGDRHPLTGTPPLRHAQTPTLTQTQTPILPPNPNLNPDPNSSLYATHPQIISEFCDDYGVPRAMRGALIKKAKITGGDLGFLN